MQPPCIGSTNLPRYVHTHPNYELRFYVLMALFFLMVAKLKSENDSHVTMRSKRVLNAEGPGAIILLQVQNEVRYLSRFAFLLGQTSVGVSAVAEGKVASVSFGYVSDACGLATRKLFKRFLEEL